MHWLDHDWKPDAPARIELSRERFHITLAPNDDRKDRSYKTLTSAVAYCEANGYAIEGEGYFLGENVLALIKTFAI